MDEEPWADLMRIFERKYIRAPVRSPRQNGLADRDVRSLKDPAQIILFNHNYLAPTLEVLALADIAKNNAPRAIAGDPQHSRRRGGLAPQSNHARVFGDAAQLAITR